MLEGGGKGSELQRAAQRLLAIVYVLARGDTGKLVKNDQIRAFETHHKTRDMSDEDFDAFMRPQIDAIKAERKRRGLS